MLYAIDIKWVIESNVPHVSLLNEDPLDASPSLQEDLRDGQLEDLLDASLLGASPSLLGASPPRSLLGASPPSASPPSARGGPLHVTSLHRFK